MCVRAHFERSGEVLCPLTSFYCCIWEVRFQVANALKIIEKKMTTASSNETGFVTPAKRKYYGGGGTDQGGIDIRTRDTSYRL